MKPETMMLDDVKYVRFDTIKDVPVTSKDVSIVVLQRGWVVVGNLETDPIDKDQRVLKNAAVIRVWGTSKGLGELAFGGPTSKTVLDKAPTMRFHVLTIVTSIDCAGEKWQSHL